MALITSRHLREGRELPTELEEARQRIEAIARGYGLDFFDTIFEMCTYEEINMVAAYGGFPTRYPHWRFGMEYLQLQKSYEYGLSKIYEMVINTDPSYAYLMDCNLMVDQKLVMSHVYGHVDFFKNNLWFAPTNRKMLDQMANHSARVRRLIDRHGHGEVERFIDVVLSLDNLIDPHGQYIVRESTAPPDTSADVHRMPAKSYMDRHINPPEFLAAQREKKQAAREQRENFPSEPTRDVLGFLEKHAPLKKWQRELVHIIRAEAQYFQPQAMTKIMNEGWATYWHTKMMTQDILTDAEVIDYADHHSGTVQMQPGRLNPYKLGVELWRHIERRWDRGQFGKDWLDCEDPRERDRWDTGAMQGRDKLFEVRRTHNDITFVDTFLTADFCREQGFFTTQRDRRTGQWVLDSREFIAIKQQLLHMLASRGNPRVQLVDANAYNRGELLLVHQHEGLDLQLDWAGTTLGNLAALWSRPVHLHTYVDDKPVTLSHDGQELTQKQRSEEAA